MEQRAQKELLELFRDAVKVGGAALEMRVRRFASLVRASDEDLALSIAPLVSGTRALRKGPDVALSSPVDADSRLPLMRVQPADGHAPEPVLEGEARRQVEQVLAERRGAERLEAAGLMPIRSVLMSGPPGVGKTMTAAWLANELSLPLHTLDLASVMSSFLGRTGANFRAVLEHAQREPCVLLLDEFDAIAKRRDDDADVGELKRLVTVILQTIDDWSPVSLLVAATNHGELLDPAVWRRFDLTINLPLPIYEQRVRALVGCGVPFSLAQVVGALSEGQNMSVLVRAVESSRKQQILSGTPFEESLMSWASSVAGGGEVTQREQRAAKRDVQIFLRHLQGESAREIATSVGVSHTTVIRTVSRLKEIEDGRT